LSGLAACALARSSGCLRSPREVPLLPLLTESLWSLQPEATTETAAEAESAPSGGGAPPGCTGASSQMLVLAVMFAVFYFLLIRPQQKRQRETDDLLKSLRRGDKVRTSGGIRGEIVDLTDTEVTLLIAEKVKVNILRAHIASRVDKAPPETKSEDPKAAKAR
jgi:preprotein translocase subunit YajC